jgi:co-chaperonin GroES (HSP10)
MTATNDTGVTPIKDQVLVRRDQAKTQSDGGIWYPDGSSEWPVVGTVLAMGPLVQEPGLEPGARVAFKSRAGTALAPDVREGAHRPGWERVIVLRTGEADPTGKTVGDILGFVENEQV